MAKSHPIPSTSGVGWISGGRLRHWWMCQSRVCFDSYLELRGSPSPRFWRSSSVSSCTVSGYIMGAKVCDQRAEHAEDRHAQRISSKCPKIHTYVPAWTTHVSGPAHLGGLQLRRPGRGQRWRLSDCYMGRIKSFCRADRFDSLVESGFLHLLRGWDTAFSRPFHFGATQAARCFARVWENDMMLAPHLRWVLFNLRSTRAGESSNGGATHFLESVHCAWLSNLQLHIHVECCIYVKFDTISGDAVTALTREGVCCTVINLRSNGRSHIAWSRRSIGHHMPSWRRWNAIIFQPLGSIFAPDKIENRILPARALLRCGDCHDPSLALKAIGARCGKGETRKGFPTWWPSTISIWRGEKGSKSGRRCGCNQTCSSCGCIRDTKPRASRKLGIHLPVFASA